MVLKWLAVFWGMYLFGDRGGEEGFEREKVGTMEGSGWISEVDFEFFFFFFFFGLGSLKICFAKTD